MNTQSQPTPPTLHSDSLPTPHSNGPAPQLQLLSSPASKPRKTRRNGVIARLPKVDRDMVSRMLYDGVPCHKIVDALDESNIKVTVRNISNWKTRGGYEEWRQEQAHLLDTRLQQDALTNFLRQDPNELPEVGLQIAATRFSQLLLRPDTQAKIDADPKAFLPILSMLCRLSREILNLQKYRDLRQTPGNPGYRREREKLEDQKQVEITRQIYSGEIPCVNPNPPRPKPAPQPPAAPPPPAPIVSPIAASVSTPPPAPDPEPPAPPIQHRNGESAAPPVQPVPSETQALKSQISNLESPAPTPATADVLLSPPPQTSIEPHKPTISTPAPAPPPVPVEYCPACHTPLPPLLPDGERPLPACSKCGSGLLSPPGYKPKPIPVGPLNDAGDPISCPHCGEPITWLGKATRLSAYCARCHKPLPKVNPNTPVRRRKSY